MSDERRTFLKTELERIKYEKDLHQQIEDRLRYMKFIAE